MGFIVTGFLTEKLFPRGRLTCLDCKDNEDLILTLSSTTKKHKIFQQIPLMYITTSKDTISSVCINVGYVNHMDIFQPPGLWSTD